MKSDPIDMEKSCDLQLHTSMGTNDNVPLAMLGVLWIQILIPAALDYSSGFILLLRLLITMNTNSFHLRADECVNI